MATQTVEELKKVVGYKSVDDYVKVGDHGMSICDAAAPTPESSTRPSAPSRTPPAAPRRECRLLLRVRSRA